MLMRSRGRKTIGFPSETLSRLRAYASYVGPVSYMIMRPVNYELVTMFSFSQNPDRHEAMKALCNAVVTDY